MAISWSTIRTAVAAISFKRLSLLLFVVVGAGLAVHLKSLPPLAVEGGRSGLQAIAEGNDDRVVYERIVEKMREGSGYYHAAAQELRAAGYPMRPALTFRLPSLAVLLSWLPDLAARQAALIVLSVASLLAFYGSLGRYSLQTKLLLSIAATSGIANAGFPYSAYLHEAWAGALVLLALACHRRPLVLVGLALAAALIREQAFVLLGAIGLWAMIERDWRRFTLALAASAIFAIALAMHFHAVAAVVEPGDKVSPGWLSLPNLGLLVATLKWNMLTINLSPAIAAGLFAGSLISFVGWREYQGRLIATMVWTFSLILLVLGRPDNDYWGVLIAPFSLMGWAFVWRFCQATRAQEPIPGDFPAAHEMDQATIGR